MRHQGSCDDFAQHVPSAVYRTWLPVQPDDVTEGKLGRMRRRLVEGWFTDDLDPGYLDRLGVVPA